MQISNIKIKNFKGLKEAEYSPSRFGCVVGENNAGKSSLLQALVYALNRPTSIDQALFYDLSVPIVFRLEVGGVTAPHLARLEEAHRNRIAALVDNDRLVLITQYQVAQKVELLVERRVPADPRYMDDQLKEVFHNLRGAAVQRTLADAYPEFGDEAPVVANATQAKEYLRRRIAALPTEVFTVEQVPLPTGISSSITSLLPEPIYIPAVKNVNDDLKTSQTTSFGRLLGLLLQDMEPDLAELTRAFGELNAHFNRTEVDGAIEDNRHQKVRELESNIEGLLAENFPAVKIELNVPPPELKTILNSARILVDDGSKDSIENKGDGIKRSLTFALLQCFVNRFADQQPAPEGIERANRPVVFLFEEPELYLHPKSQRILFSNLEKISQRHQVIVTTHSPLFFAPGATASFVRIARIPSDPKPIGKLHQVNFDLDTENADAFRLAKFEHADAAFFSRRVVLFEGESDDSFFRHIARFLAPQWDFESKNVALVRVSGKGNFSRFKTFFEAFGIEVKIVADLDALFEGFHHLGAAELEHLRSRSIQDIDAQIQALGISAEPSSRQIKSRVKSETWQQRYETAKLALRSLRPDEPVESRIIEEIEGLFVWEQETARVRACREHAVARSALVPCLDALRAQGVCVLSKGAIEDYYPAGTLGHGSKPERALDAITRVPDSETAISLSTPLAENREPELVEICGELFRGLVS